MRVPSYAQRELESLPLGTQRNTWCIKDGKILDCQKNPPECPECAAKAANR